MGGAARPVRLTGTLAHEVMSITGQLLACFDDEAAFRPTPCHPAAPCCTSPAGDSQCNGTAAAAADTNEGRERMACADGQQSARTGGQALDPSHAWENGTPEAGAPSGGSGKAGPVPVSALLAHLLFLRANGGLAGATALADTFGTAAFAAAAAAARVPDEFIEDIARLHPTEPAIVPGAHTMCHDPACLVDMP